MEGSLAPLGEAVQDFPSAELSVTVLHHDRAEAYHVEARLKLNGKSVVSGDWDAYLDSAFQRCLRKLIRKVEAYRARPDRRAEEEALRRRDVENLNREVVAPEGPEGGVLGRVVAAGDYKIFRDVMSGYEDWLRKRVGRWIQRYPKVEAQVGTTLHIGDVVEEVFLNAFERFGRRPVEVPLHEWLDGLIDPSLKAFLRHGGDEAENASLVRSLRQAPV
jgi:ribosome-associated translation inhibitor RaiA